MRSAQYRTYLYPLTGATTTLASARSLEIFVKRRLRVHSIKTCNAQMENEVTSWSDDPKGE